MRISPVRFAPVPPTPGLQTGRRVESEYLRVIAVSATPLSQETEQSPYRLLPGVVSLERWLDLNA
jgi:hypothetical protein